MYELQKKAFKVGTIISTSPAILTTSTPNIASILKRLAKFNSCNIPGQTYQTTKKKNFNLPATSFYRLEYQEGRFNFLEYFVLLDALQVYEFY